LNYSRKASGEIHDPISFKPFSEHSYIVAVATTGNVFLGESVKGNKDLLEDKAFKKLVELHGHSLDADSRHREDLIVLQDPHGVSGIKAAAPVPDPKAVAETSKSAVPKRLAAKADQPCEFNPKGQH
jgi:peptidyl-prolyl cis-trans isomerase-like protein 2